MLKLEKAETLHPARWFHRLEAIALGDDASASVAAIKVLAEFRFGKPMQEAELSVSHDLGPSVLDLLEEIATSDRHRAALEERERRRLTSALTVEKGEPQ